MSDRTETAPSSPSPLRAIGPAALAGISVALGVLAGVGADGFRALIALFHNLLFLGRLSAVYDTNVHSPGNPWGLGVALAPVVGSFGVVFLVKNFAPEARGHGVPEVVDAIYYERGVIRPVVALVKSFASALSIGSGGSVGREGPIIQIGAAVGSTTARLLRASAWQVPTLVAAGGAAGIAATFNTPIGGVLFAVEVLLHEVSVRTIVPVALATATATYVGRRLLGSHPAFQVPAPVTPIASGLSLLVAHALLGALTALASFAFIRALYASEDVFERLLPRREYLRHALGMLVVGAIGAALWLSAGHLYVEGVGYATILDVLTGKLSNVGFLLVLLTLKLVATCLTLGSGASGGVFSPSLFMGAMLGGAYGLALRIIFKSAAFDPAAFALAGMAGVVAGGTGAVMTAIVMIFEMTLDYSVVLPMTITAAVSFGLRRSLSADSIYSMKLSRRGHVVPQALQSPAHLVRRASDLPLEAPVILRPDAPLPDLPASEEPRTGHVLVVDHEQVVGFLPVEWLSAHRALVESRGLAACARRDFVVVSGETPLAGLLASMNRNRASLAVVVGRGEPGAPQAIRGVISQGGLAIVLAKGLELFED